MTKSNRLFFLSFFLYMSVILSAQTQQGYVKTLGRPNKQGDALSGVTIRVKGGHNAVVSQGDGTFSLLMSSKKNGDTYALQQVQKSGYVLNETDIIGRKLAFSDKVPLSIVMVSTEQLLADKHRIENNAYQAAERNYKKQIAQLEQQMNSNAITIEKYWNSLHNLQDKFEKYQSLIGSLSEHYAHTDYDELSEIECEINKSIENGELGYADSLIRSLFNPVGVLERNRSALSCIDKNVAQAQGIIAQANAAMKAVLLQQEKDAEYLYKLYTISLARFENEKAAQYIETRAKLDTMNANWQFDVGHYCQQQNQFDKAEHYYKLALKLFRQENETAPQVHNPDIAATLHNLAGVLSDTQRLDESEAMYKEALKIRVQLAKDNQKDYILDVVQTLNNLAIIYSRTHNFVKGETVLLEILGIYKQLEEANPHLYEKDVALTLNNIAILYTYTCRYKESEAMYKEALEIFQRLAVISPQSYEPYVATTLNNIADLYSDTQQLDKGEAMYKDALEIRRRLAYESPKAYEPDLAHSINNLAILYSNMQRYHESEAMFIEALEIFQRLAEVSPLAYEPDVAQALNNLGIIYSLTQRFAECESIFLEALKHFQQLGKCNPRLYRPNLASSYKNLAVLYLDTKRFVESREMYKKAIELYRQLAKVTPQIYNQNLVQTLANASFICIILKRFAEAEQYSCEGLTIDSSMSITATNLAAALLFQGKYDEAEKIYRQYKEELKDSFLGDFRQFAEAGVIPKEREADVERIKIMLEQ